MTCSLFVKVNNIDIPSGSRRAPKRLVATVEALCPRLQGSKPVQAWPFGKRSGSPKCEAAFSCKKAASQKDLPRRGKSEQFRYLLRRRRTRKKLLASRSVVSAFTSEQRRRHVTFCGKGGARKRTDVFLAKKNGAKRTLLRRGNSEQFRYLLRRRRTRKKLLASQSVVSAFTSEQRRRHVTFCGKGGARKRADVFLAKKNGTKRTLLRRGSSSCAATRALALAACLACPIALRFSRALGACAISPVRALLF